MPTPSIQTLRADAQQVLNLDSISAVRSVVAASLANANGGTPLNPNLTTQQLWNEFYQIVTQPKSDIESIIANQLMKFLYAPPAPGGVGADKQVIFNDGGVLAGDPQFLWNKTTNLLTVTGAATITGDLTVDTSTLKVDSANNRVGIGTTSPDATLDVTSAGTASTYTVSAVIQDGTYPASGYPTLEFNGFIGGNGYRSGIGSIGGQQLAFYTPSTFGVAPTERYRIDSTGVATWSNVGGVAGTAMTLNATGLGIGTASPATKLHIDTLSAGYGLTLAASSLTGRRFQFGINSDANLAIYDTSAAAVRMIIDGSGNLGIGVTPTVGKVQTNGAFVTTGAVGSLGTNPLGNALIADFSTTTRLIATGANTTTAGVFKFINASSNASVYLESMTLDASGNLLVGTTVISPSINGSGAITAKGVAGITLQTVSALATDYTLPIGAFAGILTIRSNGGGGSAVWMLDPNAGAVQISNNIVGRTITFTFSGGSWKLQQTVGTVPSTYNYLVLATQ